MGTFNAANSAGAFPVQAHSEPAWNRNQPAFHGIQSEWRDSNPRPSAPKADALARLRYTPKILADFKMPSEPFFCPLGTEYATGPVDFGQCGTKQVVFPGFQAFRKPQGNCEIQTDSNDSWFTESSLTASIIIQFDPIQPARLTPRKSAGTRRDRKTG